MPKNRNLSLMARLPFVAVHLGALLVFFTGFTWTALAICIALYAVRMFGITAGFHRYFSHRSFKTSRLFQFALAVLGTASAQHGPIWWAAHHRHHHRHSDTEEDLHSPVHATFWWAHAGWILSEQSLGTNAALVRDLTRYPELRWLERFHYAAPMGLAGLLFAGGWLLQTYAPQTGITGLQLLAWGFFMSTVLLYHGTFTVNSICHRFGTRPYDTKDQSRNNFWVALWTLGEGWHNNHHRFPGSEKHGHTWWQFDPTHIALRLLEAVGIVWDIKTPSERALKNAPVAA